MLFVLYLLSFSEASLMPEWLVTLYSYPLYWVYGGDINDLELGGIALFVSGFLIPLSIPALFLLLKVYRIFRHGWVKSKVNGFWKYYFMWQIMSFTAMYLYWLLMLYIARIA